MEKIHVDSLRGPPIRPVSDRVDPVLFFGRGLCSASGLRNLLDVIGAGGRQTYIATDRLSIPEKEIARSAKDAGLIGIEFPLPSCNRDTYDRLAGSTGGLEIVHRSAVEWFKAGVDLWIRVPLGDFNRFDLPKLGRFITSRLPGTQKVIFHCQDSIGRQPTVGTESRMAAFPADLYATLIELENARLQAWAEHRDGLPLCLFRREPEPLRYFRLDRSRTARHGWLYEFEARPDRLTKTLACEKCRQNEDCRGVHVNLSSAAGFGGLSALCGPGPGGESDDRETIYRGSPHRLRDLVPLDGFLESGYRNDVALRGQVQASVSQAARAGLHDIHLDGFHLSLARAPWIGNPKEPVIPSLALTTLTPFVRAAGARVDNVDFRLQVRRNSELARREDAIRQVGVEQPGRPGELSPAASRNLRTMAENLVDHLDPSVDLQGVSVEYYQSLPLVLSLVREWKRRGGGPVVLGGRGRLDPVGLIKQNPEVDYCVHGEGEIPLLMLCRAIVRGDDLRRVPGLAFRTASGEIVETPAVFHSLDLHPPPEVTRAECGEYDGHPGLDASLPVFPYQFVVGCPHRCGFCGEFNRFRFRVRSPELVTRDLAFLHREYGYSQFFFVNTQINVSRAYMHEFLEAMERARLDIQWCDCCRPAGINGDDLARLRRVGCTSLTWGIDIMSQSLSGRLWKGINLDLAAEIMRLSHEHGIRNLVNLIVGMPGENDVHISETIDYLKRNAAHIHEVSVVRYGFRSTSPLGMWPARFGFSPVEEGVDEIGGRKWPDISLSGTEVVERICTAVRDYVRLNPALLPAGWQAEAMDG